MVESIWQNKGIENVAQVLLAEMIFIRFLCRKDSLFEFFCVFALFGIIILCYRIKKSIDLKKINNFIYSNVEKIYVKYEDCDVKKVRIGNMLQYEISYTLKKEQPYKLSDKFEIDAKREKEFELCLRYQNELEFVFRKDNPNYNFINKSDAINKFDSLESKMGWQSNKRAFWYVIIDIIYAIYGTVTLY